MSLHLQTTELQNERLKGKKKKKLEMIAYGLMGLSVISYTSNFPQSVCNSGKLLLLGTLTYLV